MNIFYYEVNDNMIAKLGGKYFYNAGATINPVILTWAADRIWKWDQENNTVMFLKNRNPAATVDYKEFLLTQLRSEEY
jgi:hypothetical protein